MANVKMNVGMLCAYMKMTTEELAKAAHIDPFHLGGVRSGRIKMNADDLIALSDATGIDVRSIETSMENQ
jgi:hypothetical protein